VKRGRREEEEGDGEDHNSKGIGMGTQVMAAISSKVAHW
jgi:hypothetical protein